MPKPLVYLKQQIKAAGGNITEKDFEDKLNEIPNHLKTFLAPVQKEKLNFHAG